MPNYLDNAATTPLDPAVLEAMMPFLRESYGNASSVHALGRRARFAVEESRETVAGLLGAEPSEIVFTSGATEANNLAIKGALGRREGGLLTALTEHEAVLTPARTLRDAGRAVRFIEPSNGGGVALDAVANALAGDIALVSLMHVNNETGVVNPIAEIAASCRARGILVHTDAVQSAGHFAPRVADLGVDMMSVSAHKFYGPKGVGCLYVRGGTELSGLVEGGSQERRRRGGTENVAAIVGLARAMQRAYAGHVEQGQRLTGLRNRLLEGLEARLAGAFIVNTPLGHAAPHILNIAFRPHEGKPIDGEMLLLNMDMAGIAVSSGSACTSGAIEPSHVLLAMGVPRETAAASVRFSLGRATTEASIDHTVAMLKQIIDRMRR
ncbi:MAG: cysteine desulfurase family protein [Rhodothermales bacterium]